MVLVLQQLFILLTTKNMNFATLHVVYFPVLLTFMCDVYTFIKFF